jgi:hypothetical protein
LGTLFKLLFFKKTREEILYSTSFIDIALELLSDKNPNIRKLTNTILDYVQIQDEEGLVDEIKQKRFEIANSAYCRMSAKYDKEHGLTETNEPDIDDYD